MADFLANQPTPQHGPTAEAQVADIARLRDLGWGPARILSGIGHPGYGRGAARILDRMLAFGLTAHEAIYGGQSAARKVFEVREAQAKAAGMEACEFCGGAVTPGASPPDTPGGCPDIRASAGLS
jgi:hypothetical protein